MRDAIIATDAERAFTLLATRLAKGRPVDKFGPGGSSDGLFGSFGRGAY